MTNRHKAATSTWFQRQQEDVSPDSVILNIIPDGHSQQDDDDDADAGLSSWVHCEEDYDLEDPPCAATEAKLGGVQTEIWSKMPAFQSSMPRSASFDPQPLREPVEKVEFTVIMEKTTDALGVDVIKSLSSVLVVGNVKPGPLLDWNTLHPDLKVMPSDHIFEINGHGGSHEALIRAARGHGRLEMRIRRYATGVADSPEIRIVLAGPIKSLGLDVTTRRNSLKVINIREGGPIHEWNSTAAEESQVKRGDRLLQVNNLRGTPQQLIQAVKSSTAQTVLIFSPGSPADRESILRSDESNPVAQSAQPQSPPLVSPCKETAFADNESQCGHFTLDIN